MVMNNFVDKEIFAVSVVILPISGGHFESASDCFDSGQRGKMSPSRQRNRTVLVAERQSRTTVRPSFLTGNICWCGNNLPQKYAKYDITSCFRSAANWTRILALSVKIVYFKEGLPPNDFSYLLRRPLVWYVLFELRHCWFSLDI